MRSRWASPDRPLGGAALATVWTAAPAWSQTLAHGSTVDVPLWRIVAALGLCLGLALAAAFVLKARGVIGVAGPGRANTLAWLPFMLAPLAKAREVRVIETLRINPSVEVCLLAFNDKRFLIAASGQNLLLLDRSESVTATGEAQS